MSTAVAVRERTEPQHCGLRMTAEEFQQIVDDGYRYELIDGVVIVTPSPTPQHQDVLMDISSQIWSYLGDHPVGKVLPEIDVRLGQGPTGGDLVYRPEVIFIRTERLPQMRERIVGPPDLVVEVISPGSRRYDSETKKSDYERVGVLEYWLIDPLRETLTFYRLQEGRFVEVTPQGDTFASQAVPGFLLDLAQLRKKFRPW